jgi:hypothetical protein
MSGLNVRLEEDKRDNVESGFPTDFEFSALGEHFTGTIYAFKKGSSEKYKRLEGVLFTSNGQTHGYIPQSFFTRKRVGMSYLAESLLVIVECDLISKRAREVLFMNSRDRLSEGDLRREIESELENILGSHPGLRELRERRRREAVDAKLADSRPLKDVLNEILKKSPGLTALFVQGADIRNPFRSRQVGEGEEFRGAPHPTFFKLFPGHEKKECHQNLRFRLQFETDVVNDYFSRDRYPGRLRVFLNGQETTDFVRNLWNGVASVTVRLPEGAGVGNDFQGHVVVEDETLIEPFRNEFVIHVIGPHRPNGGGRGQRQPRAEGNGDRISTDKLGLPQVTEVREERWQEFDFDKFSALRAMYAGENGYDFHLNMDNVFLRTELQSIDRSDDAKLIEARFKYAMVLLGLAILKDQEFYEAGSNEAGEETSPEQLTLKVTRSFAPVVIPMIDTLGALQLEDILEGSDVALEYE